MPIITFVSGDMQVEARASAGENLLRCARQAGIAMDAPCSGSGLCGKCRVRLIDGRLDSSRSRHIDEAAYADGWRLACASRVDGDAVIEIPEASFAYRRGMQICDDAPAEYEDAFSAARVAAVESGFAPVSGIRAYTLSLNPPSAEDTLPDNERAAQALAAASGASEIRFSLYALKKLARTLRECAFQARCVVEEETWGLHVLDVLPGRSASIAAGLAIDLGTTSVTGVLVDLEDGRVLARASVGNAQIQYGADVINRIVESTREGGVSRLQRAVLDDTIAPLTRELCRIAGISAENVYKVCIAGNTTMNHLLLGLYADPIRMEPYIPTFLRAGDLNAREAGLAVNPGARLLLAPNVGSYVGGDITAGVMASMLWKQEGLTLFIDLGTNGELVLGGSDFMLCCACSAGPAFEGGEISCGMRASSGAIDSIRIDPETMAPAYTTIGGKTPTGVCGSGLIDLIAELFRCGIIDGRGRFIRDGERVRFDRDGQGRYVVCFAGEAGQAEELAINEADIDAFIRAKGAVFSAVMTMLNSLGMEPDALERVYIAGGIGSGIDMRSAVRIGMLPDLPPERYTYLGNTALTGAYLMLTSIDAARMVDELAGNMTYLELSTEPGYMDAFVAACFLPHTDDRLFSNGSH